MSEKMIPSIPLEEAIERHRRYLCEVIEASDDVESNKSTILEQRDTLHFLEELQRHRKTLNILADHEPSWSDDFLRARASLNRK